VSDGPGREEAREKKNSMDPRPGSQKCCAERKFMKQKKTPGEKDRGVQIKKEKKK